MENLKTDEIFYEVLLIQNDSDVIKYWRLEREKQYKLGRSLQNDIIVHDVTISKLHAFIYFDSKENKVLVKDNKSLNGTRIGERKIDQRLFYYWENEQKIVLGDAPFYLLLKRK
jgi:pSer/pThr/pTyr-binding forkhead associated (FHA) protein